MYVIEAFFKNLQNSAFKNPDPLNSLTCTALMHPEHSQRLFIYMAHVIPSQRSVSLLSQVNGSKLFPQSSAYQVVFSKYQM